MNDTAATLSINELEELIARVIDERMEFWLGQIESYHILFKCPQYLNVHRPPQQPKQPLHRRPFRQHKHFLLNRRYSLDRQHFSR